MEGWGHFGEPFMGKLVALNGSARRGPVIHLTIYPCTLSSLLVQTSSRQATPHPLPPSILGQPAAQHLQMVTSTRDRYTGGIGQFSQVPQRD